MGAPPIPFPGAEQFPLVGQPLTIHNAVLILNIVCNCEAKTPLLLVGLGGISYCKGCRKGFRVLGIEHDVRTGKPPHYHIDIVVPAGNAEDSDAKPS